MTGTQRSVDPKLNSAIPIVPSALATINGTWSAYGEIIAIRLINRGTYRLIVNTGTRKKHIARGITSNFFAPGACDALFKQIGDEPLDRSVKRRLYSKVESVKSMVEYPSREDMTRIWEVKWQPSVRDSPRTITHTEFLNIMGTKHAELALEEY